VSCIQTRPRTLASWSSVAVALILLAASNPVVAQVAPADVTALLKASEVGDLQGLQAAEPGIKAPGLRALVDARLDAARFDDTAAERDLKRYFASGDADPARQAMAWSIASDIAFAQGDYAAVAKASARWAERLPSDDPQRQDANQSEAVARALAGVPRQAIIASNPTPVATRRDKVGLMTADALINGQAQMMIVDTGASLSVLSMSAAKRLGVRLRDGASIHSATRDVVPVRLGVADTMEFAGFRLSNVVFLVLDDAQLQGPRGYQIEAIIGFPVLRAMKRIRFTSDGRLAPEPASSSRAKSVGELRVVGGSHLFVTARLGGAITPLHLDTGATDSSLSALFAARHPDVLAGLARGKTGTMSVGGTTVQEIATWKAVPVEIAGRTMSLPSLEIAVTDAPGSEAKNIGALGQDFLGGFCGYTLDFQRATFELGDPKGSRDCQPKVSRVRR
jgi:predicted aspartyl protease